MGTPANFRLGPGSRFPFLVVLSLAIPFTVADCTDPGAGGGADPTGSLSGELVTYVADFEDGHSARWHALRTRDGREIRLSFPDAPVIGTGSAIRVWGAENEGKLEVERFESLPETSASLFEQAPPPTTYAAPAVDTYALVLVDLGGGVNVSADTGAKTMFSATPSDKSFASYYAEVSYGHYTVTGDVIGPYSFSMTTCDTTGMYQAIEKQITGTYNHLIYYFNKSSLCSWGGLGEEGSVVRPAKRAWMNGSLSCVVLMQEPGHNLGLMHANSIKCGTSSFSTTPATSCTITEYGSAMSTMGAGCRQFNAYERWYMQWLSACNGVRVPGSGTFNLLPLETLCPGGTQVLQVPFPATLVVSDPQATSTNTAVNLKNYYLELRTAGGIFDTYSTSTRGGSTAFSGPTVFIYASDDVKVPAASSRGGSSVWTELINTTPSGSTFTGLTAAGQSFADPAGGPTITLTSISATGATVEISNPNGSGDPTCIDGTTLTTPGATACGPVPDGGPPIAGTGGSPAADGGLATGGAGGTRDAGGITRRDGGTRADGADGTGGASGSGGTSVSSGNGGSGGGGSSASGGGGSSTGTGGRGGSAGSAGQSARGGSSGGGTAGASNSSHGGSSAGSTNSDRGGSGGSNSTTAASASSGKTGCSCGVGEGGRSRGTGVWVVAAALLVAARSSRRRRAERAPVVIGR